LSTAYGLHNLTPWGRILGILVAAVSLLGVPVGTTLAIFLLIYYFKPEVQAAFGPKTSPSKRRLAAGATTLWKPLATFIGVVDILLILVLLGTVAAVVIPRMSVRRAPPHERLQARSALTKSAAALAFERRFRRAGRGTDRHVVAPCGKLPADVGIDRRQY
jgi:hypothetical protein